MESTKTRERRIAPELHRLALAVVLMVLLVAQVLITHSSAAPRALLFACAVASAGSLLTVARWPYPSVLLGSVAAFVLGTTGSAGALLWVAPMVVAYTAANQWGRRAGLVAALAGALAIAFGTTTALTTVGMVVQVLRAGAVTAAAAAFGETNRLRRERLREAELRAEQAEIAREAQAALAIEEERLRIARELHDITAHSLSVVAIQSELARRTLRRDPDAAEAALDAIGSTSRQALGELRGMLGQLRGDTAEDRAPAPSLGRLGELTQQLDAAGMRVETHSRGDLAGLTPFVEASAFRILQEAVTNVVRHSHAGQARIEVERTADELHLRVTDDGRGGEPGPGGHGLTGMRERAASVGGALEAGPLPGGGWRVEARLPLVRGEGDPSPSQEQL